MRYLCNIHSLPFLFTSTIFLVVPLIVLLKNRKSEVNRSFFILGLVSALWQFPYFVIYNLKEPRLILLWLKIAYVGLAFITSATYHFISNFLSLKRKVTLYLFYALSFIFALLVAFTGYITAGFRKFPWGYCSSPGKGYILFLMVWILPLIFSLRSLYREYKKALSPYDKKRIKYLLITLPIGYSALLDALPIFGVNIYPFGFIPLIFFAASTTYAIIRYRLLNIEIIIKKMSLIVLGFVLSASLLYLGTMYLQPYLSTVSGRNWVIIPIAIAFLMGLGLLRFINYVRQMEEAELSKKFAYRLILKREASRLSEARDIQGLAAYVIRDLTSLVRLDYAAIFILDAHNKKFSLIRNITRTLKKEKIPPNTILSCDSPLINVLLKQKKPFIRSETEYYLTNKVVHFEESKFLIQAVSEASRLGAEIAVPCFCEGELLAVITLGNKLDPDEIITAEDIEIFSSLANNIARALYGFMLKKEKIRLIVASQNTVIGAIEAKDSYTRGHTDRVAHYTTVIGMRMGKDSKFSYDIHNLSWSAQLHDVGKIAIPDSILLKAGPLNEDEWRKVKMHPLIGIKIINPVREWLGEDICQGILHHHENFDGSGYPFSKAGEQIHIFARIIRVADAFDAMTSDRPYRPALSKKVALEELNKYKGIHFDPAIVNAAQDLHNCGQM